jgi:hypothetical protein
MEKKSIYFEVGQLQFIAHPPPSPSKKFMTKYEKMGNSQKVPEWVILAS